mgnify:CR=1 FL=1
MLILGQKSYFLGLFVTRAEYQFLRNQFDLFFIIFNLKFYTTLTAKGKKGRSTNCNREFSQIFLFSSLSSFLSRNVADFELFPHFYLPLMF